MSRLDELIAELCPNGVEYKSLGEIATIARGGNFQKKDFCDRGVPCIHYGQIYTKYGLFTDKTITFITEEGAKKQKFAKTNDIIMAVTSENIEDVCKCLAWLGNEDVAVSGHSAIISHNQNPKYLVYYFHSQMFFIQKRKLAHGTKVIEVTPDTLKSIKLPVPPLEVQREIVHILDSFTLLTAELTARKKQYEFYRNTLLTFDNTVKIVPLADIADIGTGSSNTNEGLEEGKYPFYVRSQEPLRKNEYEYDETAIITAGDGVGVGKVFHYVEGKYALHQRAYRIHINTPDVLPRYYFHYMRSAFLPYIQKTMFQGSVASIRRPMLNQFPVPVPTLEVQKRLINVLDNFESICTDLNIGLPAEIEARQKQYEYYRDLLLTFAETGSKLLTDRQTDRQTELSAIKLIQYVFGYVMLPLSKICHSISSGKAKTKDNIGKYPVYGSTGIIAKTNEAVYNKTNILVARVGANAGYTHLAEGCYDVSDNTLIIDVKNEYNLKYVYYQLVNMGLNRYAKGGGQPLVTAGQIKEVVIAIPAMREQERIVSILDRFDTLCNDLSAGLPAEIEARQKQYEYYRDKLLSFKELPK